MSTSIFIETPAVNRDNLADFLGEVQGCWKSASLLWMRANSFPVLPGLILNGWTDQIEGALLRFCHERNFSELLVRIETPGQRWTRRRGGYTIPINEVRCQVADLAAEGAMTILLEPAAPYSDMFSLTSACDLETGKLDVEVVGPGFDASDILRGDILPHERFELFLGGREKKTRASFPCQAKRLFIVGREDYQASIQQRLVKIGARLRNPSFPDEAISNSASGSNRAILVEEATNYLRTSRQSALLDHAAEYDSIPSQLLSRFLEEFMRLFERIRASEVHWPILSLASSFLSQERLVIWDFFPPGEYDTSVLSRL